MGLILFEFRVHLLSDFLHGRFFGLPKIRFKLFDCLRVLGLKFFDYGFIVLDLCIHLHSNFLDGSFFGLLNLRFKFLELVRVLGLQIFDLGGIRKF